MGRFKVDLDTPGLKIAKDGTFKIPISAAKLKGAFSANWLPAPKGGFYLILRIFQPKQSVVAGTWTLPEVTKVD